MLYPALFGGFHEVPDGGIMLYESVFTVMGFVSLIPFLFSIAYLRCQASTINGILTSWILFTAILTLPDFLAPQYGTTEMSEIAWAQAGLTGLVLFILLYVMTMIIIVRKRDLPKAIYPIYQNTSDKATIESKVKELRQRAKHLPGDAGLATVMICDEIEEALE
jgi:hypothetical protein